MNLKYRWLKSILLGYYIVISKFQKNVSKIILILEKKRKNIYILCEGKFIIIVKKIKWNLKKQK